ncbi:dTDP-4-dehydrorhamnose 3,5-epimerase [Roseicyclus sp. F158]|uniref:dTDP-4-dehydrorhamnose 3,5-epimerase n=1 Tax=Tropicimonas omnivorans TaxID=3075590 RepID=A0ABU3DHP3_9RHOB|nr:dTDP-4-dehydrorhamnose 3,5-epimerase [Roseicyclus sp. F158]MDT0683240.1 dTDP-4-dehydrorhamnose 3,5-epimerase [Roseicyclus sp. F158]
MVDVKRTKLDGVFLIAPKRFGDVRGFFAETYRRDALRKAGIETEFVQDNHSLSHAAGTVRGLHYQSPPHAQAKLVRCGRGRLFDVAVDARAGSPSYGHWVGYELSFENGRQLFIPEGFLHGFMSLEDDTEIVYKCSDHYAPDCDGTVHWQSCGIEWPKTGLAPLLSEKDAAAVRFSAFESPFVHAGVPA